MPDAISSETKFLQNLWDAAAASALSPLEQLRYRSNRLGDDLRITNFGGGNTSSKFDLPDPLTGKPTRVLAVKGSGGDLRSIAASGFAILYADKLEALIGRYRGEAHEDEMVAFYPLAAFGENRVAASIDTPLHAFLPFDHVDHLHPDWAIALAASANGKDKLAEFNQAYGRKLAWLPWQRPGFELALMLRRVVQEHPGCDGVVLGGHGLFTWGDTQQACYLSSIRTIDQMGEFIADHTARGGRTVFGGPAVTGTSNHEAAAVADPAVPARRGLVQPAYRGALGSLRRRDDVRQLGLGGGAVPPRDQLPRSLPAHAHQPDVRAVESGHAEPGPAEVADRRAGGAGIARITRPTTTRTPTRSRPGCATPTRRSWWCRGSACSASPRTSARRGSPPSSSSTPST